MPSQSKGTTRTAQSTRRTLIRRKPLRPQENAFSAHFLDKSRRRESVPGAGSGSPSGRGNGQAPSTTEISRQAHWRGPWDVETVSAGDGILHVVTRQSEPAAEGGGARLAFLRRQDALLAAAALAALATPNHLRLNTDKPSGRRNRLGYPVHDGPHHLGHITRAEDDFLAYYHAVRCLTAHPEAGALWIEAQDTETLNLLGRAIMRRLA